MCLLEARVAIRAKRVDDAPLGSGELLQAAYPLGTVGTVADALLAWAARMRQKPMEELLAVPAPVGLVLDELRPPLLHVRHRRHGRPNVRGLAQALRLGEEAALVLLLRQRMRAARRCSNEQERAHRMPMASL